MALPNRLYCRAEIEDVFDTGMGAIAALMDLVARCEQLDACLKDPIANGFDGATTRAQWRQSLAKAQAYLVGKVSNESEPEKQAGNTPTA